MKLTEFASTLNADPSTLPELEVSGLSADSRKIDQGFVFFALSGAATDGARFVHDAVKRGAAAVICADSINTTDLGVPVINVENPRQVLARMAALYYGQQPETIVAVTGTSGKTSVATFLQQIWTYAGHRAAFAGTTGVVAPGRTEYGALTTPDPVTLHSLMAKLAEDGITHMSLEASSHGLDQYRLDGVQFAAGAFTNLGRDHMDYHPTIEHYLNAKMRLFENLVNSGKPAVIWTDDEFSPPVIERAKSAGCRLLTVGRSGEFIRLVRDEHRQTDQIAEVETGGKVRLVKLPLAGEFQLSNALVAAGLAHATGVNWDDVFSALETLKGASGRLELVARSSNGAPIYVDYAHKPDALQNVLTSVRPFTTGRIVLVFGCGGDRDPGKRSIMGQIATELADVAIVTDDNPRTEDPAKIRKAILDAAPGAIEIADRDEAIAHGVSLLEAGDVLIVAGKGHEPGQTIGTTTIPFSDHDVVRKHVEALV